MMFSCGGFPLFTLVYVVKKLFLSEGGASGPALREGGANGFSLRVGGVSGFPFRGEGSVWSGEVVDVIIVIVVVDIAG